MIRLNRLDGEPFLLNAELIKYVESRPDTFVTLTTGDRIVVSQTPDEVLGRTLEYHQTKHLLPPTPAAPTPAPRSDR
ncbi:MAG: flagellar FlbD family protein [Planctomycetota bacterium]